MLIKKAVAVRKHLQTNRKDKDSKFRLILIESRSMSILAPLPCAKLTNLVSSPPPFPLLQDRRCPPPDLEVRERHCLYPRRIKGETSVDNC